MEILTKLTILAATLTFAYTIGPTEASEKMATPSTSKAYQENNHLTTKAKGQNYQKQIDLFQNELSQNALDKVLNTSNEQEIAVTKKIYELFKQDTTTQNNQQTMGDPSLTDGLILAYQLNVTPKHLQNGDERYAYAGAVYRTIIYNIIHENQIKLETLALDKVTPTLNCTTSKIDKIIATYKNNQEQEGDNLNISKLRRLLYRILTPDKYYPNNYPKNSCGKPTLDIQKLTNEQIKPFQAKEGHYKATEQELADGYTILKALSILKQILQTQNIIDDEETQKIESIDLIYAILEQQIQQERTQQNNEPAPIISKYFRASHIKELEQYYVNPAQYSNPQEIIQEKTSQILQNIQDNENELMQTLILARIIKADDPLYSEMDPYSANQFKSKIKEIIKGWKAPKTLASYYQDPGIQSLKGILQDYTPSTYNQSNIYRLISLLLYTDQYDTDYMLIDTPNTLNKVIKNFQPSPTAAIATPAQIADCKYLIKLIQNIHDKLYATSPTTNHEQEQKQAIQGIIQKLQQQQAEAQKETKNKEKEWYKKTPTQKVSITAHLEQQQATKQGNDKSVDIDINKIEQLIKKWIQHKEKIIKDKEDKLKQLAQDIKSLEQKYKQLAK